MYKQFFAVLLKRDQQTNKSRGFGFITFENPSDADEAVKQLDKKVCFYWKQMKIITFLIALEK